MAANNNAVKNQIILVNPDGATFDQPRRMEVCIRLDQFYRSMVAALRWDGLPDTGRFVELVKLYIFSGALFEAWVNAFLRQYLEHHAKELGRELFYLIERGSIKDKYELVEARFVVDWWPEVMRTIGKVVATRNRLMHFKDAPDVISDESIFDIPVVDGKCKVVDLFDGILNAAPNPRIYNQLMDEDSSALRTAVLAAYENLAGLQVNGGKPVTQA